MTILCHAESFFTDGSQCCECCNAQDPAHLPTGPAHFLYSARGTLEARQDHRGLTQYEYDAVGNLRTVALPDGRTLTYRIDAHDRRIGKEVDGRLQQAFLYDGKLRIIAELEPGQRPVACSTSADCSPGFACSSAGFCENGGGQAEVRNKVRSQFIYATRSHVPDLMWKDGVLYRLLSDHLGSIRYVVEAETGTVAQALTYDAWGQILSDTSPGFQPFAFAGGLYDPDTNLYRFGARDYDPTSGRWTSKDPILFQGGDLNLYAYANNDPVNALDPTGLEFIYSWDTDTLTRSAVAKVAANIYLQYYIEQIAEALAFVDIGLSGPFDDVILDSYGAMMRPVGVDWVEVRYNVTSAEHYFEQCGFPWSNDPASVLVAHELGHAYSALFLSGNHSVPLSIMFENLQRAAEYRAYDRRDCLACVPEPPILFSAP